MATIYDLFEVSDISENTTYSTANGNLIDVVESISSSQLNDGEFDQGDNILIDGISYTIDLIEEPSNQGSFLLGDGSSDTFNSGSETNLDVAFLTVTSGAITRYFIIPNDSYGDMNVQAINTGNLNDVAGNDAKLVSTVDNQTAIVCFTAGTLIETADGKQVLVDHLQLGDVVMTVDHGLQTIKWIGSRYIPQAMLGFNPHLYPIRIAQGVLGHGFPKVPLLVSPQHRVLVRSAIAQRMFDRAAVLVAAKHLLKLDGVRVEKNLVGVEYFHFMFENHELVFANGAACESFYPGPQAIKTLSREAQEELYAIFPELVVSEDFLPSCRPLTSGKLGQNLVKRHKKNRRPLIEARPEAEYRVPAIWFGPDNASRSLSISRG